MGISSTKLVISIIGCFTKGAEAMNTYHSIYDVLKVKGAQWKTEANTSITHDVEKLILELEPYVNNSKNASHMSFLLKDLLEVLSIDFKCQEDRKSASMLLIEEIMQAQSTT
ncbi:hypothetical protein RJ45_03440 [Photobacterium gaetbulicola]|uniref:Uncharacterized protein n=1 Tax=Photobacterium gaetbulicola TaxID=1295392 RepID=A0A0B9GJM0_9GAMM|nr:hypothetical protein [Photobacterium gaetbulicola]KHT64995.1 hypothetical protein RJ45_03440 [Photobacterium gaetbulicola]